MDQKISLCPQIKCFEEDALSSCLFIQNILPEQHKTVAVQLWPGLRDAVFFYKEAAFLLQMRDSGKWTDSLGQHALSDTERTGKAVKSFTSWVKILSENNHITSVAIWKMIRAGGYYKDLIKRNRTRYEERTGAPALSRNFIWPGVTVLELVQQLAQNKQPGKEPDPDWLAKADALTFRYENGELNLVQLKAMLKQRRMSKLC